MIFRRRVCRPLSAAAWLAISMLIGGGELLAEADRELLERAVFLEAEGVGIVSEIRLGEFHRSPGPELAIAGDRGAILISRGRAVSRLTFPEDLEWFGPPTIRITDVDGDGSCEYLKLSFSGGHQNRYSPFAVLDHAGEVLWTYNPLPLSAPSFGPWITNARADIGDLDGDGTFDLVISGDGTVGLQRVALFGERAWHQRTKKYGSVRVVDLDGDDRDEIVYFGPEPDAEVLDAQGKKISEVSPPTGSILFDLIRWPALDDSVLFVAADREADQVLLVNSRSELVLKLDLPDLRERERVMLAGLLLSLPKGVFLALRRHGEESCSVHVWNREGEPVFRDEFDEFCSVLTTVPSGPGGVERLLLGGRDRVWQYRPAN